jgi:hypothetical protein
MNIGELIADIDHISGSQSSLRLVKQLVFDMAYEGSLLADLDKSLWIHFDLDSAMDDCRNGLTYKNSPESGVIPLNENPETIKVRIG